MNCSHLSELTPPDPSAIQSPASFKRSIFSKVNHYMGWTQQASLLCVGISERSRCPSHSPQERVNCKTWGKSSICWNRLWRPCWRQAPAFCSQMRWLHSGSPIADRKAKTSVEKIAGGKQPELMLLVLRQQHQGCLDRHWYWSQVLYILRWLPRSCLKPCQE